MVSRRQLHIEFDKRVLKWMAPQEDFEVSFVPLEDSTEAYRLLQSLVLTWQQGVISAEAFAKHATDILGIRGNEIPEGVMLPNNENSAARTDIDPNGAAFGGGKKQAASPTQGRPRGGSGAGEDTGNSNDIRNDTLT